LAPADGLAESELEGLRRTFVSLCSLASPTRHERACADWIVRTLTGFGLSVEEDDAGAAFGGDTGNLLARIPGASGDSLLLCGHMDTVPLAAPVRPILRGGFWQNENDGILGADNKVAVAAMIEIARRLAAAAEPPVVGVELLFTPSEEDGLLGACEFDPQRLRSDYGYVFDHATPMGEIVTAAPSYMRIDAEITGRAAHAGVAPERGVSAILAAVRGVAAMPNGRLDPGTTANVGVIEGGSAANVVPERCRLQAEVRSLDPERFGAVVTAATDALQQAADGGGCDLKLELQQMFTAYRVDAGEPLLRTAKRALRAIGCDVSEITSGGGSDAAELRRRGFPCTNLANGTERAHQLDERVSDRALADNLRLMLALIDQAGAGETDHDGTDQADASADHAG
jgi:tripeptide aminopeptidase